MPAFKFKMSDCVSVPGEPGVQGRISGQATFYGKPNDYQIAWLAADFTLQSKVVSEPDLIAAQPVAGIDGGGAGDELTVTLLPQNKFSAGADHPAKPQRRPASKRKSKR